MTTQRQPDHQVFISYSVVDKEHVTRIAQCLEPEARCWFAPRDIATGSDWAGSITGAIKRCPVFLLLLTEASGHSKEVAKEVSLAFAENKRVMVIHVGDAEPSPSLLYHLCGTQWMKFPRFEDLDESRIRSETSTILDLPPRHSVGDPLSREKETSPAQASRRRLPVASEIEARHQGQLETSEFPRRDASDATGVKAFMRPRFLYSGAALIGIVVVALAGYSGWPGENAPGDGTKETRTIEGSVKFNDFQAPAETPVGDNPLILYGVIENVSGFPLEDVSLRLVPVGEKVDSVNLVKTASPEAFDLDVSESKEIQATIQVVARGLGEFLPTIFVGNEEAATWSETWKPRFVGADLDLELKDRQLVKDEGRSVELTVSNKGQAEATNVKVSLALPSHFHVDSKLKNSEIAFGDLKSGESRSVEITLRSTLAEKSVIKMDVTASNAATEAFSFEMTTNNYRAPELDVKKPLILFRTVILRGTIVDPDENLKSLEVHWGDGKRSTLPAKGNFVKEHDYGKDGTWKIEMKSVDRRGKAESQAFPASTNSMSVIRFDFDKSHEPVLSKRFKDKRIRGKRKPKLVHDRNGREESAADFSWRHDGGELYPQMILKDIDLAQSFTYCVRVKQVTTNPSPSGWHDFARIMGHEFGFSLCVDSQGPTFCRLDYNHAISPKDQFLKAKGKAKTYDGEWHFLTAVFKTLPKGDTYLALYINGDLAKEKTLEGRIADFRKGRFFLGPYGGDANKAEDDEPTSPLKAIIDDIEVFDRALSAEEIKHLAR